LQPFNASIQQLLLEQQQQSQQNANRGASVQPLSDQINQLLMQQQRQVSARNNSIALDTTAGNGQESPGPQPTEGSPLKESDFSADGTPGHPKKFKRQR
jgi:hypothetical protein